MEAEVQASVDDIRWMKKCPRWSLCAVNVCPLDPLRELRSIVKGDPDTRCTCPVRERAEIAAEAAKAGVILNPLTDGETRSGRTVDQVVADAERATADRREKGHQMTAHLARGRAKLIEARRAAREAKEAAKQPQDQPDGGL